MPIPLSRRERDPEFLRVMAVLAEHSLQSRYLPEMARQRAHEAIVRYYNVTLPQERVGAAT